MTDRYDCVIVGGGPAGLTAALYLGRACRRVALVDSGDARNMAAGVMHNFITNDGVTIDAFRQRARADLFPYHVRVHDDEVTSVVAGDDHLLVRTRASGSLAARTVIYAAGLRSKLPDLPGVAELWGKAVFECPYCHAWEMRGGDFAVYGGGVPGECLAATLTAWTSSVTYLSDRRELPEDEQGRLKAAAVPVVAERVMRLRADATSASGTGVGVGVELDDGRTLRFRAVFLHLDAEERLAPLRPWLQVRDLASVQVDRRGRTSVPRLYVAGDAADGMPQAVVAAASGALTGMAVNSDLVREDRPGSLYDLPS